MSTSATAAPTVTDAVRTLMRHALPGVIVGALTTAATFYAFLATDFRGMTELGFLTGSGILVFLLCVVFVLPGARWSSSSAAARGSGAAASHAVRVGRRSCGSAWPGRGR